MTAFEPTPCSNKAALHEIARQACERIAPTWPLDQMIAVNPLWELRDQPWAQVAEQLWRRAGSRLTLSAADYRAAWQNGQINQQHLTRALAETAHTWSPEQLLQFLDQPAESAQTLPLLEDMAKAEIAVPGSKLRRLVRRESGRLASAEEGQPVPRLA